ncbi:MAG: acetyl-CoA acetyltransferase [Butyricicoccus sp.]|nr:acetyl-CoA acetyltransferase [Butyricicoccus sp.]
MNKVYVLGGAQTDFERNWSREGKNVVAMLREVVSDGCENANITYDDIISLNEKDRVACFVGSFLSELYNDQSHVGALMTEVDPAFFGVPSVRVEAACAAGAAAIDAAVTKINAGEADVAIVVGWALLGTVDAATSATYTARGTYVEKESKSSDLVGLYGKLTDAYLEKYGADESRVMHALAHLTELAYENGKRNPNAQTRKLFMNEKQANMRGCATNPLIAGRLAQSDTVMTTDGAAVVILASEAFKKKHCPDRALPIVKGRGFHVAPMELQTKLTEARVSDYLLPWTHKTVQQAYQTAGLNANDIDVFELYDYYTSGELISLSCVDLCKPGEEYTLVEDGTIAFDGAKPVNPSGGLIGGGHPQSASGVRMFLDLFKQITGTAGTYQVPKAVKNGLMLNMGGSATSNYAFILGME